MTQIGRMAGSIWQPAPLTNYRSIYQQSWCRGYCYAELAIFFLNGGRNHRQYSLRLPTEGWPGWVGLGGWLRSEIVCLPEGSHHPSTNRARCRATALIETNALPLHQTANRSSGTSNYSNILYSLLTWHGLVDSDPACNLPSVLLHSWLIELQRGSDL